MSRARDVADVQDNLGGAVPPFVAGKNFLVNGNFDFFQRSSFSASSSGYSLDRWYANINIATATITQQTAGVPVGSQYCARVAYSGSSGSCNMWQYIESGNVKALQGKTVTVSAKFRRNASFTANYVLAVYKSSTTNGGPAASWASVGSATALNASIPTGTTSSDWVTVSTTVTIPADGTAEGLAVVCFENTNQASGAYVEISQVQLEQGSLATPFARAGGTIQGELAACRYYFSKFDASTAAGNDGAFSTGIIYSSTVVVIPFSFPQMRTRPSVASSGSFELVTGGAVTACTPTFGDITNFSIAIVPNASGLTAGGAALLRTGTSTAGIIELSAEL
jgi:hypothetical protein